MPLAMICKAVTVALLAVVIYRVACFIISMNTFGDVYNHRPGPCKHIPGVENGAEDFHQFPDGTVLISHGLGNIGFSKAEDFIGSKGEFTIFNMKAPDQPLRRLKIVKNPNLELDLDGMMPHGIGVWTAGADVYVFVVNHRPGQDVIEKFQYVASKLTLKHVATYEHQLFTGLNDVVPIGPDSFYTTNLLYFHSKPAMYFELFLRLPLANVVLFENGNARSVANGFMCNGVNVSPDKKYVYVAETSGTNGFSVYKRLLNNDLEFVSHEHIGTLLDNIAVLPNGNLVLGAQSKGLMSIAKIGDRKGAHSPSKVLFVRMKSGHVQSVTSLLEDDGRQVDGASIATVYENGLLIGTFWEKLMYCEMRVPY